jgi:hypothetical protein
LIKGVFHKEGVDGRLRRCLKKGEVEVVMRNFIRRMLVDILLQPTPLGRYWLQDIGGP